MIFLLIQDGKILAGADKPSAIDFSSLDRKANWEIVKGIKANRVCKILGPVVKFYAKPGAKYYWLTSLCDGYHRVVNHASDSVDLFLDRLRVYEGNHYYNDPDKIPLMEGGETDEY